MKDKKNKSIPVILTVTSFVCFVLVYGFYVYTSIDPNYIQGLVFVIPFVALLGISLLAAKNVIGKTVTNVFTIIVVVFAMVAMPLNFLYIAFDEATTFISDIAKYERVLKTVGYPENELVQNFPSQMPETYQLINFRYNGAFMQADEELILDYQTDSEGVQELTDKFSKTAIWTGTLDDEECQNNGLATLDFRWLMGKNVLPADLVIYLFFSEPIHGGYTNHARFSLAAISQVNNEVLFYMEDW